MTLLLLFVLHAVGLSIALARSGHRWGVVSSAGTPPQSPTRVLIVGAAGGTGRQLVTQALARGFVVTALVRNPSKLRLDHPGLTVMRGDVLDPTSVDAAMRGQEAVLSALGHNVVAFAMVIASAVSCGLCAYPVLTWQASCSISSPQTRTYERRRVWHQGVRLQGRPTMACSRPPPAAADAKRSVGGVAVRRKSARSLSN